MTTRRLLLVASLGTLLAVNLAAPPAAANHTCDSAYELPRLSSSVVGAGYVTGRLTYIGELQFWKVYLNQNDAFEAAVSGTVSTGIWFVTAWWQCSALFSGSYAGAFVAPWSGWYFLHVDAVGTAGSYVLQYAGT